jgi:hypothetical protein
MIHFSFGKIGKFDIARPTPMELVGLGLVLCFFVVVLLLWR